MVETTNNIALSNHLLYVYERKAILNFHTKHPPELYRGLT
jgi:hypothetical protein